jgi:hypothetical protein
MKAAPTMRSDRPGIWYRLTRRAPEAFLALFALFLLPAVVLGGMELFLQIGRLLADVGAFSEATRQNPWPVIGTLVSVPAIVLLGWIAASRWVVLWAVARKLIAEAMHRKVILVLLVFFAVLMPVLPFILTAEGSLKHHVQIILLYSMTLALVLMSLVAIVLATVSISTEIERHHVYITDTKPMARWEFLFGKWIGIVVMCSVCLMGMTGISYVLVRYIVATSVSGRQEGQGKALDKRRSELEAEIKRLKGIGALAAEVQKVEDVLANLSLRNYREKLEKDLQELIDHKAAPEEIKATEKALAALLSRGAGGYDPVRTDVMVGRKVVAARFTKKELNQINDYVDEAERQWLQSDDAKTGAIHGLRAAKRLEFLSIKQTVVPGAEQLWSFAGLEPGKGVTVRFKALTVGRSIRDKRRPAVYGSFWACRREEKKIGVAGSVQTDVSYPKKLRLIAPDEGWRSNQVQEVRFPAGAVDDAGYLYLMYVNTVDGRGRQGASVVFDVEEMIEVLQQQDSGILNFYRSVLVLMCHIALVAAMGLLAGALFSFPVATLLVLCLFLGGMVAPWYHEHFVKPDMYATFSNLSEGRTSVDLLVDTAWRRFAGAVVIVLPNFGSFNPMSNLVNGKIVTWGAVSEAGAGLVFSKGILAMLIAAYWYSRRELARIIV